MLEDIFKGLAIQAEFTRPKDYIKTVFSAIKDEMLERVRALESEIGAVKLAMNFEKEGFDFYRNAASRSNSQKEKELFERLSVEENDHYSILMETFTFLDNTGHWYMYEERGIIEG